MTSSTGLAAAILAALALAAGGCGGDDKESGGSGAAPTATRSASTPETRDADQEAGARDKDCDEVRDLGGKPKRRLPEDVPLVAGARVYESQGPFGRTVRYFAVAKGGAEGLPEERDKVAGALAKAGYKVLATDQEEGAEAEAHLSGPHTVDIQVINLCEGKLRIRYTVS